MNRHFVKSYAQIIDLLCKGCMLTVMRGERIPHISMFHNIRLDGEICTDEYECNIGQLIDYVVHCRSIGMEFVSIDSLLVKRVRGTTRYKSLITFDDGFASVFNIAAPILVKLQVPFVVYVTTSFIGQKGFLSHEQLIQLHNNPYCTIGMHSHSHDMFRYKDDNYLRQDFEICSKTLLDLIGETPRHYAFPYGSVYACSKHNSNLVRLLGVKSIAMTTPIKLTFWHLINPYSLPRLNIPACYNGRIKRKFRGLKVGM